LVLRRGNQVHVRFLYALMAVNEHALIVGAQARALSRFLRPMLDFVPEKRATAAEMLQHEWLDGAADAPSSPE